MLKIILQFNLASVRSTILQWNWRRANGGGGVGTGGNRAGELNLEGEQGWEVGIGVGEWELELGNGN